MEKIEFVVTDVPEEEMPEEEEEVPEEPEPEPDITEAPAPAIAAVPDEVTPPQALAPDLEEPLGEDAPAPEDTTRSETGDIETGKKGDAEESQ